MLVAFQKVHQSFEKIGSFFDLALPHYHYVPALLSQGPDGALVSRSIRLELRQPII